MKILELTLKRKWYEMILCGIKREEYREIKPYWFKRFIWNEKFIDYNFVHFRNGYSSDAPNFYIECKSIKIGKGKTEWGAVEGVSYFVIELVKIVPNPRKVLRG